MVENEHILEISEYLGEGYMPMVDFESWRVAVLRWEPTLEADKIETMERHRLTDEVFILLSGWAALIVGSNHDKVDDIHTVVMEKGKIYNVKTDTWHSVVINKDGSILIVENCDTGVDNSEFCSLSQDQKQIIRGLKYED
jgi:ureidoglycolate hydrolase